MYDDLLFSAGFGAVLSILVVGFANSLPIPAYGDLVQNNDLDSDQDFNLNSSKRLMGNYKSQSLGSKFPSASFSSTDSLQITEEIIGVDLTDLDLGRAAAIDSNECIETSNDDTAQASAPRTKNSKGDSLQMKENHSRMGRSALVENIFGFTPEQKEKMKDAMKKQMKSDEKGGVEERSESGSCMVKLLEWIIFIAILLAGAFALNEYTNGDFGRVVAGFFPKETAALGIKDFLESRGFNQTSSKLASADTAASASKDL